jgi:hypothetical protein
MTPADVEELLGRPISKMNLGASAPSGFRFTYQGHGESDRIEVDFDLALKVEKVRTYSLPPWWLHT